MADETTTFRINVTGTQQLNQATQSVKGFTTTVSASNKELNKVNQAGKSGALGLLAVSQAIDDVQYGFRGIVNNIPGIVMGFGAGAGVAGAFQIAAVAANFLITSLKDVSFFTDETARKAEEIPRRVWRTFYRH
jgi:hypothetical protein